MDSGWASFMILLYCMAGFGWVRYSHRAVQQHPERGRVHAIITAATGGTFAALLLALDALTTRRTASEWLSRPIVWLNAIGAVVLYSSPWWTSRLLRRLSGNGDKPVST